MKLSEFEKKNDCVQECEKVLLGAANVDAMKANTSKGNMAKENAGKIDSLNGGAFFAGGVDGDVDNLSENFEGNDFATVQQTWQEIQRLSHGEIEQKLAEEILRQKQSGEFDFEALQFAVLQMKPYLSQDSFENMEALLEKFR